MEIYPAREEPIEGINSKWLLEKVKLSEKSIQSPTEIIETINQTKPEVLLILGAGDIDRIVEPIKKVYEKS